MDFFVIMKEIFKPIPSYPDYEASNLGRIKSKQRVVVAKTGRKYIVKEKILKQSLRNGYYIASLTLNFIKKNESVHQLVAMAFLNHKPCGMKLVVDHKDDNRLNNYVNNLRIITNRENTSKNASVSSKYTGVGWNKNRWRARISINGKQEYLGLFVKEIDAHNACKDRLVIHMASA